MAWRKTETQPLRLMTKFRLTTCGCAWGLNEGAQCCDEPLTTQTKKSFENGVIYFSTTNGAQMVVT
jgi:hypothetical protein